MGSINLPAPQLITDAWLLMMGLKSNPDSIRSLLPQGLKPHPNNIVVVNMYAVPDPAQTSGFGAFTLTYIALHIRDHDSYIISSDTGEPGRFWVGYFNSSEIMRDFTGRAGIPVEPGVTTLIEEGEKLKAVLEVGGQVFIEATADVGDEPQPVRRGHLNHLTQRKVKRDGSEVAQIIKFPIPFISRPIKTENVTISFKMPESHPLYSLRPISVEWARYTKASFVYPHPEIIKECQLS